MRGDFLGGLWWILIGLFLRAAAQMSYQQLLVRKMFEGEPVRRFMTPDPVTVSQSLSVRDLVDDYLFPLQHPMFPVVNEGRLLGSVSTADVKGTPRELWNRQSVGGIARHMS